MQAVQEQLPVGPADWPLRDHRKIAMHKDVQVRRPGERPPGDFVNLSYGSNLAPERKKDLENSRFVRAI